MKNWKRNLFVGFVWGLIFFLWWMAGFYYRNWNFKLFSADSWSYLHQEFMGGWVISEASDWIFVLVLLLSVPVFIIGWNIILKVKWRQMIWGGLKKIWYGLRRFWHTLFGKDIVVGKKKIKYIRKKSHKRQRPAPLHMTTRAMEKKSRHQSDEAASSMAQNMSVMAVDDKGVNAGLSGESGKNNGYPSFLDDADFDNMSLDDIQLPDREPLNENIPDILIKNGYQVIANPEIGTVPIHFVAVDAHKIYVMIFDNEAGDWLADEERFNGEEPLWFSESSHRVSPVFKLNTVLGPFAERLKNMSVAHEVVPVLIVNKGTVINAEDMQTIWHDMNVVVCRTDLGGPDELPSVAQAMPAVTASADMSDVEKIRDAF